MGGGGLYCYNNSFPQVFEVSITENTAIERGGGIRCQFSSPQFSNMIVANNSASISGGGIDLYESSPVIQDSEISGNTSNNGGGIKCMISTPLLKNVNIVNNIANSTGGGIYCEMEGDAIFDHVLISGNEASDGGGISVLSSNTILGNVTITDNHATDLGGGFYSFFAFTSSIYNSIIWNNSPENIYFGNGYSNSFLTVAYSDIQGGIDLIGGISNAEVIWLEGNIDGDPYFLDNSNNPYYLDEDSPCIDAGSSFFLVDGDTLININIFDYNGQSPDMGAFEFGVNDLFLGDVNADHRINILDIILLVNFILGDEPNEYEFWAADINEDEIVNILDIIVVINIILDQ